MILIYSHLKEENRPFEESENSADGIGPQRKKKVPRADSGRVCRELSIASVSALWPLVWVFAKFFWGWLERRSTRFFACFCRCFFLFFFGGGIYY